MTQAQRIVDYIRKNGSISALEAVQDLGVLRLSARIYDLAKAGYSLNKRMVSSKNRFGEEVSFARYYLE